jgi:hypothetical protein
VLPRAERATVADHLEPGGHFVIEVGVPNLRRLPPGRLVRPFEVGPAKLGFDEYEPAAQRLTSHHYYLGKDRAEARSIPFRYVWPAELDLMAKLAGMTLRERFADWQRHPFTNESTRHVSVWRRPRPT